MKSFLISCWEKSAESRNDQKLMACAAGSAESPQNQGFEQKESGEIPLNEIFSHLLLKKKTAELRDDQKLMTCAAGSAESPHNKGFEQKESGELPLNEILSHLSIRFRENTVECRRVEILRLFPRKSHFIL